MPAKTTPKTTCGGTCVAALSAIVLAGLAPASKLTTESPAVLAIRQALRDTAQQVAAEQRDVEVFC
jgi:hypothetical protein